MQQRNRWLRWALALAYMGMLGVVAFLSWALSIDGVAQVVTLGTLGLGGLLLLSPGLFLYGVLFTPFVAGLTAGRGRWRWLSLLPTVALAVAFNSACWVEQRSALRELEQQQAHRPSPLSSVDSVEFWVEDMTRLEAVQLVRGLGATGLDWVRVRRYGEALQFGQNGALVPVSDDPASVKVVLTSSIAQAGSSTLRDHLARPSRRTTLTYLEGDRAVHRSHELAVAVALPGFWPVNIWGASTPSSGIAFLFLTRTVGPDLHQHLVHDLAGR